MEQRTGRGARGDRARRQEAAAPARRARASSARTGNDRRAKPSKPEEGRARVIIEHVTPEIDHGEFPVKRVAGEDLVVEADIFTDSHDEIACVVRYRSGSERTWSEVRMEPLGNDRWRAAFPVADLGRYRYTVCGWVDRFASWRRDLRKKIDAGQDVQVDLLAGAQLVADAAKRATGDDVTVLASWAEELEAGTDVALRAATDPELASLMARHDERPFSVQYPRELLVVVDRERARFSTWYELFPRSTSPEPGRHGTFADVMAQLPRIAAMGFDVLYLPPIHPIGRSNRKGPNNVEGAGPDDPGSPWAIGSEDGGHRSIEPALGTMEDFQRLLAAARDHGMEVALDIAFQCSPDHPWVREHPEWFRHRPDGTIQYAENPPKKYQDIYPLDFETSDWRALWDELRDVVRFWIDKGVRIFRVDNPHTKPFRFWEWLIDDIKTSHPDIIFLSEAFTRPRVLYRLAKLGFTQSYTYFAWRSEKWNLTEYFTELNQTEVREFCRPNLWPNTPDILTEELQHGGRPAFVARLILAATLGASYGIYGPAFELMEDRAVAPGKEEYLDSEKYQIRHWDLDRRDDLSELIALVNRIRRENPALQADHSLVFHHIGNDRLIGYSKATPDRSNVILTIVNLDHTWTQSGMTALWLEQLGVEADQPFAVHDLLSGAHYTWHGWHNYVELNPHVVPAHIFRVRQRPRDEHDFEYFA